MAEERSGERTYLSRVRANMVMGSVMVSGVIFIGSSCSILNQRRKERVAYFPSQKEDARECIENQRPIKDYSMHYLLGVGAVYGIRQGIKSRKKRSEVRSN